MSLFHFLNDAAQRFLLLETTLLFFVKHNHPSPTINHFFNLPFAQRGIKNAK